MWTWLLGWTGVLGFPFLALAALIIAYAVFGWELGAIIIPLMLIGAWLCMWYGIGQHE